MRLIETHINDEIVPPPKWLDIGGLLSLVIFVFANSVLNKENLFFRDVVNLSAVLTMFPIVFSVTGYNYKFPQFQLLAICIASIFLGSVYGGIIGIVGAVCAWPVLIAYRLKTHRFLGLMTSLGVFIILCIQTFLLENLTFTHNYYWASALCTIYTFYLALTIFCTSFIRKEVTIATDENKAQNQQAIFIAEMSHEIRTPLNAILGFTDTMQEEVFGPLNDTYKEYLGYIHQSGHHLLDLIGDILDMSKIEAGKYNINFEPTNLTALAQQTIGIVKANADRAKIKLNFYGNDEIICDCDAKSIRQIILNLLSNAIKFTPEGGKIDIRIFANSTKIWLEVNDTGRGISEEELKNIGQPYFSAANVPNNVRSTGLGLTLVKKLVEFHNGELSILSKLGDGTKITIELPRNNTKPKAG